MQAVLDFKTVFVFNPIAIGYKAACDLFVALFNLPPAPYMGFAARLARRC